MQQGHVSVALPIARPDHAPVGEVERRLLGSLLRMLVLHRERAHPCKAKGGPSHLTGRETDGIGQVALNDLICDASGPQSRGVRLPDSLDAAAQAGHGVTVARTGLRGAGHDVAGEQRAHVHAWWPIDGELWIDDFDGIRAGIHHHASRVQVPVAQGQVAGAPSLVQLFQERQRALERAILAEVLRLRSLSVGLAEHVLELDLAQLLVGEGCRQLRGTRFRHQCAVRPRVGQAHELPQRRSNLLAGHAREEALVEQLVGPQVLHDNRHVLRIKVQDLGQELRDRVPLTVCPYLQLRSLSVQLRVGPEDLDELRSLLQEQALAAGFVLDSKGVVQIPAVDLLGSQHSVIREDAQLAGQRRHVHRGRIYS
mmetsp:Transcript_43893/g.113391  ORF Transcript_43893/g.113391 Transcript_43893/m.113391 type:complete len:368 (-) Transcript_43893:103-1206(-)